MKILSVRSFEMVKTIYPSIENLIKRGDPTAISRALNGLSPFDLSELIIDQSEGDQFFLFGLISHPLAVETFDFLPIYVQKRLIDMMPTKEAAALLSELTPDDRTSFLQELPRETINELVKLLPVEERTLTLTLLGYPEGSVGRLMTPDYISVKIDWKIEDVLDHIQDYGHDSETIEVIYVVDDEGRLLDDIKIKDFLFVSRQSRVKQIVDNQFIALSVDDNDETAVNVFRQHDRAALPVINEEGVLLGIVTIDDILRLSNEEATEDMQKIGGMEALDEPYMEVPFLELMKKRAGWLIVLFLGEMLTATTMSYFEGEIAKAVVLALFLPLIISSGGNAGSQASTLVIRALALGEVKLKDWARIVRREILSGLFLGVLLGCIGFFRVTIWSLFSNIYGEHWVLVAFTIGFALVGIVLWGTLAGAILPLILQRVGADPATSSAPFVATLVDVTGLIIYFWIAILILSGTLL